jgi:DNA-binding MarR family transcriptional regulator
MNKALEDALAKVLRLPEQKQELAAELLEQLTASEASVYPLSDAERAAVREALARARADAFGPDDDVRAALHRPWM